MTENKAEKALRWVVNQIPEFIPKSNEEKMLLTIKHYCQAGADEIKRLEADNSALRDEADTNAANAIQAKLRADNLEVVLFAVIRNSMVLPVGMRMGKSKKEITDMTFDTMKELQTQIDYEAVKKIMEGTNDDGQVN